MLLLTLAALQRRHANGLLAYDEEIDAPYDSHCCLRRSKGTIEAAHDAHYTGAIAMTTYRFGSQQLHKVNRTSAWHVVALWPNREITL